MVTHPNLPLLYTGGGKNIDIWGSRLDQDGQPASANSPKICVSELLFENPNSKEYIENLKFNCYGDKIGGISNLGNLYIWKMCKTYQKPIYSIVG